MIEVNEPLRFDHNVMGALSDNMIAALSKPMPIKSPLEAYRYNEARARTLAEAYRQRPLIRMQDKNLSQLATIGSERSCRFEEIAADTGEAGIVLRGGDYLSDFVRNAVRIEEDLHISIDPNPTKPSWKTRWGGKITDISVKRDSSGIHTVELIASAQREHLKNILVATTPLFPPEVQPLSMWLMPANFRTGAAITLWIQLLRQFDPIASIPSNIFNPFGWINPLGPDALLNLSPLQWPIQVQFVDPLRDQSRTSLLTATWNDFHSVIAAPAEDAGCCARAYTFFTEDEDNPHPELEQLIGKGSELARPQRNCVLVAFEDHSGYEGPTGTAADGVVNLFASTLDDLITTTVFPIDEDDDGEVDPVFRKLFLVAPPKPWAVYRDGQHSGIIESEYHQHKGPIKTVMTGGKSPKLVNDLQTFAIKFGLSQLQTVITAGVFGQEGPAPIGSGLEELYQGQLDNKLLAWQRFTDPIRALHTGDVGYLERLERPGSAAYTVSAILTLRLANHKTRARRSFKTSIRQAAPYVIGYDILLDDRVGFEQDSIIYVDQVEAIKYEYDRDKPVTWTVSVGGDNKDEDPFSQGVAALQALNTLLASVVGGEFVF